jgi:trigger factor
MTELRQEIRQGMQSDFNALTRQHLKGALLDKLAERYHFPVPPGMLEIEFNSIWQQYEAEKARQAQAAAPAALEPPPAEPSTAGTSTTEAEAESSEAAGAATPETAAPAPDSAPAEGETAAAPATDSAPSDGDEATRAEYRDIAERRVRLGLLLAEVGRSNNISVTDEELNQALTREARRHPGYERQVLDYYRKNPEAVGGLRAPIFEDKVVDFIIELAKVGERTVSPQELIGAGGEAAEGEAAEGETTVGDAAEGDAAAQD